MRYQPYRGKRIKKRAVLHSILIVVLCIFIITCTVFLLFFRDTLRTWYESTGFFASISIPNETDTPQVSAAPVTTTGDAATEPSSQTDTSGVAEPSQNTAMKLLEIPSANLSNAQYWQQAITLYQQGKISGVSMVVKNAEGYVWYPSSYERLAGTNIITDASTTISDAVSTFKAAGLTTTAVIYAHQDHLYAQRAAAAAVTNVDNRAWRTGDSKCWLDPSSAEAQAYLTALITECKDMGFDAVLLRGLGWPPTGRLNRIVYGTGNETGAARAAVLAQQVQALRDAAAPMQLAVTLDNVTAESSLDEPTGQDVALLHNAADRLFIRMSMQTETSGNSVRTIVSNLSGAENARLVPMYSSAALMPMLMQGNENFYFVPSETNGALEGYLQ